ncbi:MAG: ketosteroid isomerase family protein [Cyanobacteria bacterium P01_C01_bin.72]
MIQSKIDDSLSFRNETAAIESYYSTLNRGKFELTAALFSEQGQLIPPFDTPVVGSQAIANYLKQEATDMSFNPVSETSQLLANGQTDVEVRGKVRTSTFSVNVVWSFLISAEGEIDLVQVNLLASLQELMHLRPKS